MKNVGRKAKLCFGIMLSLALVLSMNISMIFAADDSHSNVNDVRKSICVVYCGIEDEYGYPIYMLDGKYVCGHGTGFFVGEEGKNPEYLITNNHVIDVFVEYGKGERFTVTLSDGSYVICRARVYVYFSSDDKVEAYVVDYDDLKDMALVRLESPTDKKKPVVIAEPTDNLVGADVYAIGYPGISDNAYFESSSKWSESDSSITKGIVGRLFSQTGTGVRTIQTDAQINHGNSGGPMVKGNGSVIGVNSWGITIDGESENYALSISEVIPMLKNNNVSFILESEKLAAEEAKKAEEEAKAAEDAKAEEESSQNTDSAQVTPAPEQNVAKEDSGNSNIIMIIGIAAGAIVVLALVIIILKKGGKKETTVKNTQASVTNNQPKKVVKNATLRSMSVQHSGKSYTLGSTPAIIGRDQANCLICYKEGTAGVSGRHCSVSFDPSTAEFLVTDLKSSYGTFLMNGTKLNPNVPYRLRSGESFYVGDKANVIKVEIV